MKRLHFFFRKSYVGEGRVIICRKSYVGQLGQMGIAKTNAEHFPPHVCQTEHTTIRWKIYIFPSFLGGHVWSNDLSEATRRRFYVCAALQTSKAKRKRDALMLYQSSVYKLLRMRTSVSPKYKSNYQCPGHLHDFLMIPEDFGVAQMQYLITEDEITDQGHWQTWLFEHLYSSSWHKGI